VSHRGCFGRCSFCALTYHQGRIIQSRSAASLVREVTRMAKMPEFRGIVHDVGGPTANMYGMECNRWETAGACIDKSCSHACPSLRTDHRQLTDLLHRISEVLGVKKVFVRSGTTSYVPMTPVPGTWRISANTMFRAISRWPRSTSLPGLPQP